MDDTNEWSLLTDGTRLISASKINRVARADHIVYRCWITKNWTALVALDSSLEWIDIDSSMAETDFVVWKDARREYI